jgi:hypothetical protein
MIGVQIEVTEEVAVEHGSTAAKYARVRRVLGRSQMQRPQVLGK